jgi:hypothetical protein
LHPYASAPCCSPCSPWAVALTTKTSSSTPSTPPPWTVDEDGDGFSGEEDCDDNDAAVNPDAEELCDGLDNNCDGEADEGATDARHLLRRRRRRRLRRRGLHRRGLRPPPRATPRPAKIGDCDDGDAAIYPGAVEDDCLDPTDYNCDGSSGLTDGDGDGFAACEECDDSARAVNPSATEICDDIDNNCDGEADVGAVDAETWYQDADTDGYGDADFSWSPATPPRATPRKTATVTTPEPAMNPGATELCDALDNDCDGIRRRQPQRRRHLVQRPRQRRLRRPRHGQGEL